LRDSSFISEIVLHRKALPNGVTDTLLFPLLYPIKKIQAKEFYIKVDNQFLTKQEFDGLLE